MKRVSDQFRRAMTCSFRIFGPLFSHVYSANYANIDIVNEAKKSAQNVAGVNPSPSAKARLANLADDRAACEVIANIYATDLGEDSGSGLCEQSALAAAPKQGFIDERVVNIDPSRAPEEKFTPESLRSVFSRLRIKFTKTVLKFQTAIKTTNSRETLDTEFWESYARHDEAIYYIYKLFHDHFNQEMRIVMRIVSRLRRIAVLDGGRTYQ